MSSVGRNESGRFGMVWRYLSRRPHFLPSLIAAAMLLGTFGKWPYDYYRILRWVVCAVAVFVAFQGWKQRRVWALWVFGVVAFLFNPIVPAHFSRQTWQVIDLTTAMAFGASAFTVVVLSKAENGEKPTD